MRDPQLYMEQVDLPGWEFSAFENNVKRLLSPFNTSAEINALEITFTQPSDWNEQNPWEYLRILHHKMTINVKLTTSSIKWKEN